MKTRILTIAAILLVFPGLLAAKTMYVVSDVAKLLSEANLSSASRPLSRGESVDMLSSEGLFVKVKTDSATGFVSRMYLSPYPPAGNLKITSVKKNDQVKVRARASSYSQTASARGLARTEDSVRTRGHTGEYDFLGLEWVEEQKPGKEEVLRFIQQGGLN